MNRCALRQFRNRVQPRRARSGRVARAQRALHALSARQPGRTDGAVDRTLLGRCPRGGVGRFFVRSAGHGEGESCNKPSE